MSHPSGDAAADGAWPVHRVRVHGDGVELVVTVDGCDASPAIVLAHGVGSHSAFVREAFAAALVTAGWRLVSYDLRGHGGSTPVPDPVEHALDRHVGDLAAVVAATGAEVVGGVSLGGHVAVAWAAGHGRPRAVLAALPAWTGRAVPGQGPHAAVAGDVARIGTAAMTAGFAADTTMLPWLRRTLLRDWPRHDPASLGAALTALDGGLAPTEAELRTLPVPLGVLAWDHDPGHPLATARDWVGWAPRSALVELALEDLADSRAPMGTALLTVLDALAIPPR